MLRELNLKAVYRSDEDNLLEDFYIPALRSSVAYDRAVGFFSAAMLSCAAQGISVFVGRAGKIRLIFGGEIEQEDAEAIEDGYLQKKLSEKLGNQIIHTLDNLAESLVYRRLEALSWLVASGSLEIKFAMKQKGMYHEKIGIFKDEVGDQIVFQGSANETMRALLPDFNFEAVNVFPSWRPELVDHFTPYQTGFERLWSNTAKRTVVIDFPAAAKERLIKIAKRSKLPGPEVELQLWRRLRLESQANDIKPDHPSIPQVLNGEEFKLQTHQQDALNAWKANDFQGILALATGTGKTVAAIYAAVKLYEVRGRMFLVIAVPYQNLADQWVEELGKFEIRAIPCYGSVRSWRDDLSESLTLFLNRASSFVACVVVNRTLQSPEFQGLLKQVPGEPFVWIGDECHHHGSEGLSQSLPQNARIRLGLSATPETTFDELRNQRLKRYYGPIVYTYDLAKALTDGVLTPYEYRLCLVDLTIEEAEEYTQLSAQISQLAASEGVKDPEANGSDALDFLLFKRARLLGSAKNKLTVLEQLIANNSPEPLHLFYCGDGSVEDEDASGSVRQVEAVSRLLSKYSWKCAHFTSRESRKVRQTILNNFRLNEIDGLVAIRCLDEGIDIPACRVAYILASSRNPKQFIQRRGRILRRAAGKERATIIDFMVKIPDNVCSESVIERNLFIGELKRVSEFARTSLSWGEVYSTLKPYLERYDIEHHFV